MGRGPSVDSAVGYAAATLAHLQVNPKRALVSLILGALVLLFWARRYISASRERARRLAADKNTLGEDLGPETIACAGSVQLTQLDEFEQVAAGVRSGEIRMGRPTQSEQLQLYGLFKQATVGDCNTARPSMLEMAASAKWDAWRKLLGIDKPTAAEGYVALVEKLQETASASASDGGGMKESHGLGAVGLKGGLEAAGDWYDEARGHERVADSTLPEAAIEGSPGAQLLSAAKRGDLRELQRISAASGGAGNVVNAVDEAGRTGLIWAADRGHAEVTTCLLRQPAIVVDHQDAEGQSALHCAVVCEFVDVAMHLLAAGADPALQDVDGETPRSWVAENFEQGDPMSEAFKNHNKP